MADISRASAIGLEQFMFAKVQGAIGTGVIPGEGATVSAAWVEGEDAFKILGGGINPVHTSAIRADSKLGLDPGEIIRGPDGPHTATIEKYLCPVATGTAYDDDVLLQNLLEKEALATVEVLSGVSTTVFTTSDTGILEAGSIISIPIVAGSTPIEMGVVSTVVNDSGVDTITLKWALKFTPEDGTAIPASKQWVTRNALSATNYFTLAHATGGQTRYLSGAAVQGLTFSFNRGEDGVKMSYAIVGKHFGSIGQTTIKAGLTAIATTIGVTNQYMFAGVSSTSPMYAVIDSEVVKVTAISTDTLTIERNQEQSGAEAHDSGTAITPWSGDTVDHGEPIPNVYGMAWINGQEYEISDGEFVIGEPIEPREGWGNVEVTKFLKSGGLREATLKLTLMGNKDDWAYSGVASERFSSYVGIQLGKIAGKTLGIYLPEVIINDPVVSEGVDGAMTIELNTFAIMDSDDDEGGVNIASI